MPEQLADKTSGADQHQQRNPSTLNAGGGNKTPSSAEEQQQQEQLRLQMEREERAISALQSKIAQATSELSSIQSKIDETREELRTISPEAANDPATVTTRHIRLLHEYNEVKDVGQGLLGLIAEARGVRYVDVQREFGVSEKD